MILNDFLGSFFVKMHRFSGSFLERFVDSKEHSCFVHPLSRIGGYPLHHCSAICDVLPLAPGPLKLWKNQQAHARKEEETGQEMPAVTRLLSLKAFASLRRCARLFWFS